MPPAARVGDTTMHGTPLSPGPGCLTVLIGGMPAWRALEDVHTCPLVNPVAGPDGAGMVQMGSPTVMIGFMQAARMGDIVVEMPGLCMGPMNPIMMGCVTVEIGEAGSAGGGGGGGGAAMVAAAQAGTPFVDQCS